MVQPHGKSKVTALAKEFDLTKATISDSIKLLLQKSLVQKHADSADVRSYTIMPTDAGRETAVRAASFVSVIERPLDQLTAEQKDILFSSLLKLIHELRTAGIISVQRMCFTCSYYEQNSNTH